MNNAMACSLKIFRKCSGIFIYTKNLLLIFNRAGIRCLLKLQIVIFALPLSKQMIGLDIVILPLSKVLSD